MSEDTHEDNLKRVSARIGWLIMKFVRERLADQKPEFHVDDLRKYVTREIPTAPDSAGRILRELRLRSKLGYVVVSRRDSLYKLEWVDNPPAANK